jgi:RimJ/RimL family protein N-acetyltransferase
VNGRIRAIIETERLIIRALEPEDIEALGALWCDPAATAYLGGPRNLDAFAARARSSVPAARCASMPSPSRETGFCKTTRCIKKSPLYIKDLAFSL